MLKVKFNLRKMASPAPEIIYMVCRWDGNRVRFPSGFSVVPKNWNLKAGEVRNVITELNRALINTTLKDLKAAALACYAETTTNRQALTPAALKEYLNDFTGRTAQPEKLTFWVFIAAFMQEAPVKLRTNGRPLSTRQIQKYRTTIKILEEYEKESRAKLDFDSFKAPDFFTDFTGFLTHSKGFALNTVGSYTATLKAMLTAAIHADATDLQSDKISRSFAIKEEETTAIYLTEAELTRIFALDLAGTPRLEKVRDLFLIGCYSGLRISDYKTLQAHNIKGENLEVFQKKTGGKVIIPVRPRLRLLLEKYAAGLPVISDQKLNDYIKEVAELAGIAEEIETRRTVAGKLERTISKKWQLVTSHTARRSYATNAYKRGTPADTIMKVTGHKTEKAFKKYIRLDGEEHAAIMAHHHPED